MIPCIPKVFEHDKPKLTEERPEFFDLVRELPLIMQKHKT
jgi:hypothetical protein